MKVILIIMTMLFGQCSNKEKEANEKFITLCRSSNNTLTIDYLDSTHGISNIKQSNKNDTLILSIYVAVGKEQKSHNIKLDANIRCVSTGQMTFDIDKLGNCGNIKSGKEALDELKDN